MLAYGTASHMHQANADADTATNSYNRDILSAAQRMIAAGRGTWKYETHYSSGTTVWSSGDGKSCMITREGTITD